MTRPTIIKAKKTIAGFSHNFLFLTPISYNIKQSYIKPKIDILFPCYNPADGWENEFIGFCDQLIPKISNYSPHFIIVDDGCNNIQANTWNWLRKTVENITVLHHKTNLGKGAAIRTGSQHATSAILIFCDLDFPFGTDSFLPIIQAIEEKADIVVSQREKTYRKQSSLFRKVLNVSAVFFNKYILRLPVSDTQGGLKGFSTKGKEALLATTINGYLFDIELMKIAVQRNLTIQSILVQPRPEIKIVSGNLFKILKDLTGIFKLIRT